MNKEHFLSELSRRLDGLNGNDLYRTLEYYAEMIDDRVEDGMSEEAAVAALGDLEAIAREIMQDAPARESAKREESDEADEQDVRSSPASCVESIWIPWTRISSCAAQSCPRARAAWWRTLRTCSAAWRTAR